MRKKMSFWFIGVLLVMGAALFAQTEADFDTKAEGAPNGDGVVITKYKGEGGDVVIPATIAGRPSWGLTAVLFTVASCWTR